MTATPTRRRWASHRADPAAGEWAGDTREFDLVKELLVALVVVGVLCVALAALFSSPDDRPITVARWAKAAPGDFVATAVTELDGTSRTASYGPPYNSFPGAGQELGPLPLQRWGGVRARVDTAQDFVLRPLREVPADPVLTGALSEWSSAPAAVQMEWATAYGDAVAKAPGGDPGTVAPGDYGPVPLLMTRLLGLGQTGALDGLLVSQDRFYATDYTKPLLFLADGTYLEDTARAQNLGGDQWGMMNETGSWPGQAWLWLYTFWYQVKPFSTSDNADALVWGLMAVLSLVFVCLPFIPGLRSLPRHLGVHRLIWRQHYRQVEGPKRPAEI
jgi:hypothetical protein